MVFLTQFIIAFLVRMGFKKNYLVGQSGYDFKKLQTIERPVACPNMVVLPFMESMFVTLKCHGLGILPTEASSVPRAPQQLVQHGCSGFKCEGDCRGDVGGCLWKVQREAKMLDISLVLSAGSDGQFEVARRAGRCKRGWDHRLFVLPVAGLHRQAWEWSPPPAGRKGDCTARGDSRSPPSGPARLRREEAACVQLPRAVFHFRVWPLRNLGRSRALLG